MRNNLMFETKNVRSFHDNSETMSHHNPMILSVIKDLKN